MSSDSLVLGIDLGTSGIKIVVINQTNELIYAADTEYEEGIAIAKDWEVCLKKIIREIPKAIKEKLIACSIDGTSGTLVACDYKGVPLGNAIPYYSNMLPKDRRFEGLDPKNIRLNKNLSSFTRALTLVEEYGNHILLRHQADWLTGWMLDKWKYGEEGNNIKLGWSIINKSWPKNFEELSWRNALPVIVHSGANLGKIALGRARVLGLPQSLSIIAGTTDSNAAFISAEASRDDGVTVLGSTIVLKRFVESPIELPGITNHLINGQWICGGASNSGGAVLKKFFNSKDLIELSRQINPELSSGIFLRPLPFKGERFPINDPNLEPILKPRPISDSLYLHALLEGMARIESEGWHRLSKVGAKLPKRIITLGGGARNPQWRRLRERLIGIPIISCKNSPAIGAALLALNAVKNPNNK